MNNNNKYEYDYKTPETSPRDPFGVDSPLTQPNTPENISTPTNFVAPPPPSIPPPTITRPSTNPIVSNYKNMIYQLYSLSNDPVSSIASFTDEFIKKLPYLNSTNPQQVIDLYNAIIHESSSFFRLNQQQNININFIIESAYIKIRLHYSNINIRGGRISKKRDDSPPPTPRRNIEPTNTQDLEARLLRVNEILLQRFGNDDVERILAAREIQRLIAPGSFGSAFVYTNALGFSVNEDIIVDQLFVTMIIGLYDPNRPPRQGGKNIKKKTKKNKTSKRKTKKSKITAGMFRFIFGDQNEEERRQRESVGAQYDPEDPYAHSTYYMVRPLPYRQQHRPDTNLYPVTIPTATNAQIVPSNDNEPQTKKTKKKQTIQEPIISNLKRIDLPGTVLTRRLITDRIATSANESIEGPDAANAAAFDSYNYDRLRRKEIEIPLEIRKLIRRINYYEEELDKTDDVLLKDRHALAEQSYNPNEGIRFTAAPNAPYETKRLVEDRSHLIGEQNNRKIRLEFLQNKLRHIKNKIKEHEDKALTTIPDEDVRWMPGGKRKKSNKRKTRNKKKGGGNSISLFEEFKSLDELKSHLVNNIKVPTGSRNDPGKLNIDAVTRENNKTRNKKEKSDYRKSLKKFNKRNNR